MLNERTPRRALKKAEASFCQVSTSGQLCFARLTVHLSVLIVLEMVRIQQSPPCQALAMPRERKQGPQLSHGLPPVALVRGFGMISSSASAEYFRACIRFTFGARARGYGVQMGS